MKSITGYHNIVYHIMAIQKNSLDFFIFTFFFNPHLRIILLFRKWKERRGKERKREGWGGDKKRERKEEKERNQCKRDTWTGYLAHAPTEGGIRTHNPLPLTGNQTRNPSVPEPML